MRWVAVRPAVLVACALATAACDVGPPPVVTPVPSTPRAIPTLSSEASADRPLSVAVAVGPPTPTPVLVGDYATLVRPRIERVGQGLSRLEQHLSVLQQSPVHMVEKDWRTQAQG